MAFTYLLIGGNLGDREKILKEAKAKIADQVGQIEQESSIYETEPWGFIHDQYFLNQLIKVNTNLSAKAVLENVLQIENNMGRQRDDQRMGSRIIDIDILFYDDLVMEESQLTIPHPRLHLRRFALIPLNEIAQNMIHPVIHKSMKELMKECEDSQEVTVFEN